MLDNGMISNRTLNNSFMNSKKSETSAQSTAVPAELAWLRSIIRLSDDLFHIPGTRLRFGLDPIIGLIPGVGDLTSGVISGILMIAMARYGASGEVILKMTGNILLDYLLGSIPVIGDVFDIGFRANRRNLRLLEEYWSEGKHRGSGRALAVAALLTIIAAGLVTVGLIWALARYLWQLLF